LLLSTRLVQTRLGLRILGGSYPFGLTYSCLATTETGLDPLRLTLCGICRTLFGASLAFGLRVDLDVLLELRTSGRVKPRLHRISAAGELTLLGSLQRGERQ
jgi:hypothetical protein